MIVCWSIYDYLIILGLGMLGFVPAFIANAGMTFTGPFRGPGRPMDFGKNFIDGKRLFGKGKTWKGFIGGIIIGSTISWLFVFIYPAIQNAVIIGDWALIKHVTPSEITDIFVSPPPWNLFFRTILLAIGACVGDLFGSFLKRRIGRERGAQVPLLDQVDFILIAYLIAFVVFPVPWYYILLITFFTPLVAVLGNIVAYAIGKKHVPW